MLAKHEVWKYSGAGKVWVGKYKNSHNLLHWHYDCELLYVENGAIDVFCDKRSHSLTRGQALFVDSGQVHYMHAKTTDTVLAVFIFDHSLVKKLTESVQLASPLLAGDYGLPRVYERIRRELTDKDVFYDAAAACEIVELMIAIYRREQLTLRAESGTTAEAFKKLLTEIGEKYEFYSFNDAADFMGMSRAYFSRFFHNVAGMTFSQYLNYVRIDNAVRMIRAEKSAPVTEIASRCGFATIRNFNRTFKELTGYSPKRLPQGFALDEKFSHKGAESFNPTLTDCVLIESP